MQKITDHSTQRNVKVRKDAGSSECLCGRWDKHDLDVPLRLRTVHRTAGGHMAQARYADRGVRRGRPRSRCCQWLAGVVTVATTAFVLASLSSAESSP